jgi:uncharacterized protein (TIGR03086 family)
MDLTRTADRTRTTAIAISDDQLDLPTPADLSVRQLLHHLLGLCIAFRDAAAKVDGPTTSTPPGPNDGALPDDWRSLVGDRLDELAGAWRVEAAWDGMTKAGGSDLPGQVAGLVALDEVLLHGWDLARATGQDYAVSDEEAQAVLPFVTPDESDPDGTGREGLFGPVVAVPADAPLFDRVLGCAGRDPGWQPPS